MNIFILIFIFILQLNGSLAITIKKPQLSEVSLLLTYNSFSIVNVSSGCFRWETSKNSLVKLQPFPVTEDPCEQYPGTSSRVKISTSDALSKSTSSYDTDVYRVKATAERNSLPVELQNSFLELSLEVYVSDIKRIEILTTSRKIGVGEFETLKLQAYDRHENVFSSLENVAFLWNCPYRKKKSGWSEKKDIVLDIFPFSSEKKEQKMTRGSNLLVSGVSSGAVHISAELVGLDSQKKIQTGVEINVVESLSTCPEALYQPLELLNGTEFQLTSYIKKKTSDSEYKTVAISSKDNYQWQTTSSNPVLHIDPKTGSLKTLKRGTEVLTYAEIGFPQNHISALISVVSLDSVVQLKLVVDYDFFESALLAHNNDCLYFSTGKFTQYRALASVSVYDDVFIPSSSTSWIFVINRKYLILTKLFSTKFSGSALDLGRNSIFAVPGMSFGYQLTNELGQEVQQKSKFVTLDGIDENYPNLFVLQGLKEGVLYLSTYYETLTGKRIFSAVQKLMITQQVRSILPIAKIIVPVEQKIEQDSLVLGGSGNFVVSSRNCPETFFSYDHISKGFSSSIRTGDCDVEIKDALDESNYQAFNVAVKDPSTVFLFESTSSGLRETQKVLINKNAAKKVFVGGRIRTGAAYSFCSALFDQIDLDFEVNQLQMRKLENSRVVDPDSKFVSCFILEIEPLLEGNSVFRILSSFNQKVLGRFEVQTRDSLVVIYPEVALPSLDQEYKYISVMKNAPFQIILEGGFLESDSWTLLHIDSNSLTGLRGIVNRLKLQDAKWLNQAETDYMGINLDSNFHDSERRRYIIDFRLNGIFILKIASSGKQRAIIVNVQDPISLAVHYAPKNEGYFSSKESLYTNYSILAGIKESNIFFHLEFIDKFNFTMSAIDEKHREAVWKVSPTQHLSCDAPSKKIKLVDFFGGKKIPALEFRFTRFKVHKPCSFDVDAVVSSLGLKTNHEVRFVPLPTYDPPYYPTILANTNFSANLTILDGSGEFSCRVANGSAVLNLVRRRSVLLNGMAGPVSSKLKVQCEDSGLLNKEMLKLGNGQFGNIFTTHLNFEHVRALELGVHSNFAEVGQSKKIFTKVVDSRRRNFALSEYQKFNYSVVGQNPALFQVVKEVSVCFSNHDSLTSCPGIFQTTITPLDVSRTFKVFTQVISEERNAESRELELVFFPPLQIVPSKILLAEKSVRTVQIRGGPLFLTYESTGNKNDRSGSNFVECTPSVNARESIDILRQTLNSVTILAKSSLKGSNPGSLAVECLEKGGLKPLANVTSELFIPRLNNIKIISLTETSRLKFIYRDHLHFNLKAVTDSGLEDLLYFSAPNQNSDWYLDVKTKGYSKRYTTGLTVGNHAVAINVAAARELYGLSAQEKLVISLCATLEFKGRAFTSCENVEVFPAVRVSLGKDFSSNEVCTYEEVVIPVGEAAFVLDSNLRDSEDFFTSYEVTALDKRSSLPLSFKHGLIESNFSYETEFLATLRITPKDLHSQEDFLVQVQHTVVIVRKVAEINFVQQISNRLPETIDQSIFEQVQVALYDKEGNRMFTELMRGPRIEVFDSLLGDIKVSHIGGFHYSFGLSVGSEANISQSSGFTVLEARLISPFVDEFLLDKSNIKRYEHVDIVAFKELLVSPQLFLKDHKEQNIENKSNDSIINKEDTSSPWLLLQVTVAVFFALLGRKFLQRMTLQIKKGF
eukprot:augustus_masked-scaffold_25-processed-gene-5.53-mRNA-1 protein AED:1.00 eAED:1.00 QI:0/-1/0/0/-1/1/1/0/1691